MGAHAIITHIMRAKIKEWLRTKYCIHCGKIWVIKIFKSWKSFTENVWVREIFESQKTESWKTLSHGKLSQKTLSHKLAICTSMAIWWQVSLMWTDPKTELSLNLSWNSSLLGAGTNLDLSMISFRGFKFAQILTFPPVFGSKMREPSRGYLGANILADHTQ